MSGDRERAGVPEGGEFTALSERMFQLLALRLAIAGVVVGWGAAQPDILGIPFETLLLVSAGYVAVSVGGESLRRAVDRRGFAILSVLLLVDGAFLAFALYATGSGQSSL